MVKKAIKHFNRGLLIGIEFIGLLAVLAFFIWVGLLWRLSQGPLDVNFLTSRLEKELNEKQSGFSFDVSSTVLTWGGRFAPVELEMRDVMIRRTDNTPVLSVARIGLQLSKRAVIFGKFIPKVVKIYAPALRVIRWEDGHLTLNLGEALPATEISEAAEDTDHAKIIGGILDQFRQTEFFGILGSLEQIAINDAAVFYEDKALGVAWRARRSSILLSRAGKGLTAESIIDLEMAEDKSSLVRASLFYNWDTRKTDISVYFSGLTPALAAQQSETLKDLAAVDLPLKGSIAIKLDEGFKPNKVRFIIGSDPGTFNAMGLYAEPVKIQGLYLAGAYDAKNGNALIEQFKVNFGGPVAAARMSLESQQDGSKLIAVDAVVGRMPMDDLHQYWPETLTPDSRSWVVGHLSKGIAEEAKLNTLMTYNPIAENKLTVQKLNGKIKYSGIKVDYFAPLLPVLDTVGTASFDPQSFNLDITGGKLGDMDVTKSTIKIFNLGHHTDGTRPAIDIDVSLQGPLKTALSVLDSKPLEYPKKLGLISADVGGDVDVNVNFKFPLHHALDIHEVEVKAEAKAKNVALKNIVAGMDLTGGPIDLTVGAGTLNVKGKGSLDKMPVDFNWTKNFNESAEYSVAVQASLPLDAATLKRFGVPDSFKFAGAMPADIDYRLTHGGLATLGLKANISDTSFEFPVAGYIKTGSEKGSLGMTLHLDHDALDKITGLDLQTDRASAAGDIFFTRGIGTTERAVKKASFKNLRLGETSVSLDAETDAKGTQIVKIGGAQLDASSFFAESAGGNKDSDAAQKVTPIKVSINVDKMLTGKDKFVQKPRLFLHRNEYQRIEQMELDAVAGGKPVIVRYSPTPKGGKSLNVSAGNAGAFLSAFGLTEGVRGGVLSIKAVPDTKSGPRNLAGTVSLSNFSMTDTPVLARILNAMSLTGILDLMSNKGLAFKKAGVRFRWIDRGAPNDNTNIRMLKLSDGQTSGASLGLTFEGNIDNWKNMYDLNGTIIPVSDLNKLVGMIPLVGNVLTAGGEGVFAATYSVTGPKDQPNVTVNPLAVLAPGVLRKLFFEN